MCYLDIIVYNKYTAETSLIIWTYMTNDNNKITLTKPFVVDYKIFKM